MITTAFLQPGPFEIILVLCIILLLFGAKKLPELARALGKSLEEFKRGKHEATGDSESENGEEQSTRGDDGGSGDDENIARKR